MMQRVMIIGQPGSGKSILAIEIGAATGLPVFHIDHIHWMSSWVERPISEKVALAEQVQAQDKWVFEGGFSKTWPNRLSRAEVAAFCASLPLPSA